MAYFCLPIRGLFRTNINWPVDYCGVLTLKTIDYEADYE